MRRGCAESEERRRRRHRQQQPTAQHISPEHPKANKGRRCHPTGEGSERANERNRERMNNIFEIDFCVNMNLLYFLVRVCACAFNCFFISSCAHAAADVDGDNGDGTELGCALGLGFDAA